MILMIEIQTPTTMCKVQLPYDHEPEGDIPLLPALGEEPTEDQHNEDKGENQDHDDVTENTGVAGESHDGTISDDPTKAQEWGSQKIQEWMTTIQ